MFEFIFTTVWILACAFAAGLCDRIRGGWKGPDDMLADVRKMPFLFEGLVFVFMTSALIPIVGTSMSASVWGWLLAIIMMVLAYQQDNGWRGRFVVGNEGYNPNDSHRWYYPVRFGAIQGLLALPLVLWGPAYFSFLIYALILGQLTAMFVSELLFETHIEEGRMFGITNAWPGSELLGPFFTTLWWVLLITIGGWI